MSAAIPSYEIESIADLLLVPEEKWPELLLDLHTWMKWMRAAQPIDEDGILTAKMIWLDDNCREMRGIVVNGELIPVTEQGK